MDQISTPGTAEDTGDLSTEMQALEQGDSAPITTKDDRVIHRAKRHLRPGETRDGGGQGAVHNGAIGASTSSGGVDPLLVKNSRKSRNSYNHNRGQPKKGLYIGLDNIIS